MSVTPPSQNTNDNVFVDAAACGDLEDIKRMLADPSTTAQQVNAIDKDGRSALHYACLNDDVNLLPVLLADERVDVTLTTPRGEGIYHMAGLYSSLQALKLLASNPRTNSKGLNLVNSKNKYGETALHLCAGSGDKNAQKTAQILLDAGASMTELDQWNRGPYDCAKQNLEGVIVKFFDEYLAAQSAALQQKVKEISKKLEDEKAKDLKMKAEMNGKMKLNFAATFQQLKVGVQATKSQLNKVETTEKYMFSAAEGKVAATTAATASNSAAKNIKSKTGGSTKILSKLIEFPGDVAEIKKLVKDPSVDVAGKDLFGATALHKFASWNKPELMEIIADRLEPSDWEEIDIDGKTALHLACEMASVASVTYLVTRGVNKSIKDNKGRTPDDILNSGEGHIIERLRKALNSDVDTVDAAAQS